MADLAINALPAGSGNMLSTDRIPVDKFDGGPYITVFRTGQEIMNSITSLSTATFTNINTSINNAINTCNAFSSSLDGVLGRDIFFSASYEHGVTHNIDAVTELFAVGSLQADRVYSIKVRISAYQSSTACAVRVKEFMLSVATDSTLGSPFIQIIGGGGSSDFLFDHYDINGANISLASTGITITSGGKLRFRLSHTITGQYVSIVAYYKIIL